MRKIRSGRRRCIICVDEVNVIITYIIPQVFVITKYSSVIFTTIIETLRLIFKLFEVKSNIFNVSKIKILVKSSFLLLKNKTKFNQFYISLCLF